MVSISFEPSDVEVMLQKQYKCGACGVDNVTQVTFDIKTKRAIITYSCGHKRDTDSDLGLMALLCSQISGNGVEIIR